MHRSDIGLALAGGGPLGITYEIGALNALAESLTGVDFTRIGVHVGVSAGSAVAAALANGIDPREMCRIFVEGEPPGEGCDPFDPSILLQPAFREYGRRLAASPRAAWKALTAFWRDPLDSGWGAAVVRVAELTPTGVFDNTNIDRFLRRLFGQRGRTNDFRELRSTLLVVATDLDSGEGIEFGTPPFSDVPISLAVQASTALPLLYPPVKIGRRHYVDGALTKTMHASGAYHAGARLVFGVNPLVPYSAGQSISPNDPRGAIMNGGLPAVLSQTFRALVHSRMRATFAHYANDFPGLDFVLLEPERADADLFFTNIFSYASRRRLCEHAYQRTRALLRARADALAPILERHGVGVRGDVLADETRTLVPASGRHLRPQPAIVRELQSTLRALAQWVERKSERTRTDLVRQPLRLHAAGTPSGATRSSRRAASSGVPVDASSGRRVARQ